MFLPCSADFGRFGYVQVNHKSAGQPLTYCDRWVIWWAQQGLNL
jgi:hypothetical protein